MLSIWIVHLILVWLSISMMYMHLKTHSVWYVVFLLSKYYFKMQNHKKKELKPIRIQSTVTLRWRWRVKGFLKPLRFIPSPSDLLFHCPIGMLVFPDTHQETIPHWTCCPLCLVNFYFCTFPNLNSLTFSFDHVTLFPHSSLPIFFSWLTTLFQTLYFL